MKKILIFQINLGGHALEYLHHILEWAKTDIKSRFLFCIPKNEYTKDFFYNIPENIESSDTYFLSDKDKTVKGKCKILRDKITLHKPTDVLLLSFDQYMPYFHLLPRNVKYTSFFYHVYLYTWKEDSIKQRIKSVINTWLLVNNKAVSNILICNGTNEDIYFNKLYHSSKFKNIVDPISFISTDRSKIKSDKTVFLHMGVMTNRKGTLTILESIKLLSSDKLKKIKLIFAGVISEEIKYRFYKLKHDLDNKVEIIVNDKFCSNDEINLYCREADYLLMPYSETSKSSGMFAYSSAYDISTVATNRGKFKKIVRKYKLGHLIDDNVESLYQFFLDIDFEKRKQVTEQYINRNSIENFIISLKKCIYENM